MGHKDKKRKHSTSSSSSSSRSKKKSHKKSDKTKKSIKSIERKSSKHKSKINNKHSSSPSNRKSKHKKQQEKKVTDTPTQEVLNSNLERQQDRIAKIREERRRRSRSNSAIRHYKKVIQANNPSQRINSVAYDKQDQFWDGFTWQPKTNLHDKVRDDKDKVLSQTSRMRRVQLCNIPTGLTSRDLYAELSRFMNRNYLNDVGNAKPILQCNLNEKDRSCTLELSSVEETNRILKLESIKLLDEHCKVIRLGESLYGQSINQTQLVYQAHNWAKAQATAVLALRQLGLAKGSRPEDEILSQAGISSRIVKVGNFLNAAMAINLNRNEWEEMREDLLEGFSTYGGIEDDFFVKPFQAGLGAEAGSLFIVYTTVEEAQRAVVYMYGRTYNQRELKLIFINEQTYIRSYVPLKLVPAPDGEAYKYESEVEYDDNSEPQEQEQQQINETVAASDVECPNPVESNNSVEGQINQQHQPVEEQLQSIPNDI